MSLYYRSESSSSLTNEQIDSNFRTLNENRSITGSYTISGNLVPEGSEFDLGSSENPFRTLFQSGEIIVVSGSTSSSMGFNPSQKIAAVYSSSVIPPLNTYLLSAFASQSGIIDENEPTLSIKSAFLLDDPENPNADFDKNIVDTAFVEVTYSGIYPDDFSLSDFSKPTNPSSGGYYPIEIPEGQYGNFLPGWSSGVFNESFMNNNGGMAIRYSSIMTGGNWLDRSRLYATNPGSNPTASSNDNFSNHSNGWWQSWSNLGLEDIVMAKAFHPWDTTAPRLWWFGSDAGGGFAGNHRFANPGRGTLFPDGVYGPYRSKATYFNLLESGSYYNDTSDPLLFPPPYEDGDMIVRIWNENITHWTAWYTLMYNEDNVHYYNISKSIEYDEFSSSSLPNVKFYQDSINPGRVKLIGDYAGKWVNGYDPISIYSSNYIKTFDSWSYNSVNPFVSSSNLCLSLQNAGGTFTHQPMRSDGRGPGNSPTSANLGLCGGYKFTTSQSVVSNSPSIVWYGNNQPNMMRLAFDNTEQYGESFTLGPVYGLINNNNFSGARAYRYVPTGSNLDYNLTSSVVSISGSSTPYVYPQGVAYGYHQLKQWAPNGTCAVAQDSSLTCVSILPLIPLTTAHYPLSASFFWHSASLSGSDLTINRVNRTTFTTTLPTFTASLYSVDGTLPNDRTVDLNGFDLTFSASNGEDFTITSFSGSKIAITNLPTTSFSTLVSYNSSNGVLSATSPSNIQPYFYSTGSTTDNAEVYNGVKLALGEVYNFNNPDYLDLDNSIYRVNTAGKYYINVNGTLGEDSEPSSNGLGWWKVALQVNGATVAESTAKQSEVGDHYGGLDLMYVGDLALEDEIQIISDTSLSSVTSSISNTTYRFSAEYLGAN